ncbi:class I SAM-dependent methyltransferase, partial [bacterium]|nr:class I SAM-dependent methyltransferase [bacterium]
LEFSQPQIPVFKQLYLGYVSWILPKVGQCLSGKLGPYSYLPQSVKEFPDPETLEELIQEVGFTPQGQYALTGGIVTLHLAQRAS